MVTDKKPLDSTVQHNPSTKSPTPEIEPIPLEENIEFGAPTALGQVASGTGGIDPNKVVQLQRVLGNQYTANNLSPLRLQRRSKSDSNLLNLKMSQPKLSENVQAYPTASQPDLSISNGQAHSVQRVKEEVVTSGKATLITGFLKKNVEIEEGTKITVDFDEQKKNGNVPVYEDNNRIGWIKSEEIARKIVAGQLPKDAIEIDSVIVDVHKLTEDGVQKTKGLAAKYQVPAGTVLYHGTYPESVESIQQNGLDPNYGGKGGGSDYDHWAANCKGYVYLATSSAKNAAQLVEQFWLGQGDRVNEKGDKEPTRNKQNKPPISVMLVTVPEEGLELEADPDLGGMAMRTRTMINKEWITGTQTFAAGGKREEYNQAFDVWKADYKE